MILGSNVEQCFLIPNMLSFSLSPYSFRSYDRFTIDTSFAYRRRSFSLYGSTLVPPHGSISLWLVTIMLNKGDLISGIRFRL